MCFFNDWKPLRAEKPHQPYTMATKWIAATQGLQTQTQWATYDCAAKRSYTQAQDKSNP